MPKPTTTPGWNAPDPAVVEPLLAEKNAGFAPGYKPPAEYFNWFWRLVSQWITWLKDFESTLHVWTSSSQIFNGNGTDIPLRANSTGNHTAFAASSSGTAPTITGFSDVSNAPGVQGQGIVGPGVRGTSSGAEPGVKGDNTGTGPGVKGTGSANQPGVLGESNGSGAGVQGTATSSAAPGVNGTGNGASPGVKGTGGATGPGVEGWGGGPDTSGVNGVGGSGSGAVAGGPGVVGVGGPDGGAGGGTGGLFQRADGVVTKPAVKAVNGSVEISAALPASNAAVPNMLTNANMAKLVACISVDGTINPSLVFGMNVASLPAMTGAGGRQYVKINFAQAFVGNYAVQISEEDNVAANASRKIVVKPSSKLAGSVEFEFTDGGSFVSGTQFTVTIYGGQ